jgi:hypothetical protein
VYQEGDRKERIMQNAEQKRKKERKKKKKESSYREKKTNTRHECVGDPL